VIVSFYLSSHCNHQILRVICYSYICVTGQLASHSCGHSFWVPLFMGALWKAGSTNLASEWVIEQKPQLVKHNRYIRRSRHIIMFLYKYDADFDLAGNVVQVRDDISPKKDYQTKSLDGACFLALSAYTVVDTTNPTYYGVVMGVIKEFF
jgi:hypothetical protein